MSFSLMMRTVFTLAQRQRLAAHVMDTGTMVAKKFYGVDRQALSSPPLRGWLDPYSIVAENHKGFRRSMGREPPDRPQKNDE